MMAEYGDLDATALGALVRDREVSPLELVDEAIRRVEQVNGTLNAVVTEMFDHARDAARQPPGDGPFAGVPFLMKDYGAEVAGVRFTEGSSFLADYVPAEDSEPPAENDVKQLETKIDEALYSLRQIEIS